MVSSPSFVFTHRPRIQRAFTRRGEVSRVTATARKPTKTMTVPARLFTGEGHFVEETWMAGLRPTPAYLVSPSFTPSSLLSSLVLALVFLPRRRSSSVFKCSVGDARRRTRTELPALRIGGQKGGRGWFVVTAARKLEESGTSKREEKVSPFSFIFAGRAALLKISSEYQVGVVQ